MSVFPLSDENAQAALSQDPSMWLSQPHRAPVDHEFNLRRSRSDPSQPAIAAWGEIAEADAAKTRAATLRHPNSPTAWSRLAFAERLAGRDQSAIEAANQTFLVLLRQVAKLGFDGLDVPAAVAAARILATLGQNERADVQLASLPTIDILTRVRAGLALDRGDFVLALTLLDGDESAPANSMRGYLLLRIGRPRDAIQPLKRAIRSGESNADEAINLALAFWLIENRRKAILHARLASRMAPSRKDISFALLHLLLSSGEADSANRELARVRADGYAEPPEFIFFQAQLELAKGRRRPARDLMRDALRLARSLKLDELAAEIEGNIASVSHAIGECGRNEVRTILSNCLTRAPRSLVLVEIYAGIADRASDADFLGRQLARIREYWDDSRLYEVLTRIAYLRCDFEAAARLAEAWMIHDPTDTRSYAMYVAIAGPLQQKWSKCTKVATVATQRFAAKPPIMNNFAYVLALAGQVDQAEAIVDGIQDERFYVKATKGLVQLAKGRLQEGLRLYREAALLADQENDGGAARSLMTLYEGMAIRHFSLVNHATEQEIIACALPTVSLPEDWEQNPAFVLMSRIAGANKWPWPISVTGQ